MSKTWDKVKTVLLAEQATGMRQNGESLIMYGSDGNAFDNEIVAKAAFLAGKTVEIPAAGAGSYVKLFEDIFGFDQVQAVEQTSSAGDWTLAVKSKEGWFGVSQSNRYPRLGFCYGVVNVGESFETKQDLLDYYFPQK